MPKSVKICCAVLASGMAMAMVVFVATSGVTGFANAAFEETAPSEPIPGIVLSDRAAHGSARGTAPPLSAEARMAAARGLVDLDGNGLSDGLEDKLAGLAADAAVDVIVTFSGPGDSASAQVAVGPFSVKYDYTIIDGFAATMTSGQARALAATPGVFRVEEDATVYAYMDSARPDFGAGDVVTDPDTAGIDGSGVKICLIDTGVQGDHEAFNEYDGETVIGSRILEFRDFTGDMSGVFHDLPYDYHGHGTHTAATAAGSGVAGPTSLGGDPVNAPKARGVAPGAALIIAKVLRGDGTGADSGVLAGIQWCVERQADIISASLGIPGSSLCMDAVCQAMENAAAAGVVPVVAAGNTGDLPEDIGSPAASPSSITVAAVADFTADPADPWFSAGIYLAPFSSLGPAANGDIKPDIAAPGVTILSAYSNEYVVCDPLFGCLPDIQTHGCGIGCYAILSGTSMATPYVAGVVALMLEANPALTPAAVKQIIAETAQDRFTPGKDIAFGHGLIDGLSAVKRALNYAEGTFAPNQMPAFDMGTDSVPNDAFTDIHFAVSDQSLPVAVTITIDGTAKCAARLFGSCLGYSWDPDLEMDLYTSNAAGDLGALVFSSGCPAIGDCGQVGQRETAYVAANAAVEYYVARIYGWDGDPNFGKGGSFTYEISNGIDMRNGTPPASEPPVASFDANCTDLSCSFTDTSTDDGTIVAWSWDFGDGNGSTAQNPTHDYAAAGTYTVVLTVTDDQDLSDPASQDVTATQPGPVPPSASFTVVCADDLSCSFTDTSTDDGTIVGWLWDFGDGATSGVQNPTHGYAAPGTYTVGLTVTDDDGETDFVSQSATASDSPSSPQVTIDSLDYSTEGGRNSDKHLNVAIGLIDDLGVAVAGATVRIDVYRDGIWAGEGSGATGGAGFVEFSFKNAAVGCYTTDVRDISADGLTWDGVEPDPEEVFLCK